MTLDMPVAVSIFKGDLSYRRSRGAIDLFETFLLERGSGRRSLCCV